MTRKEAIKLLKAGSSADNEVEAKAFCEAYDIAIKALKQIDHIQMLLDMWKSDKHTYYVLEEIIKAVEE